MTIFNNLMSTRYEILNGFNHFQNEPFFHFYREHLISLIDIVNNSGDRGEGSLFFRHGHKDKDLDINAFNEEYKLKRQGLALFALSKTRVLEIGFNSGFSALLMLSANPNLQVVCVDIGSHTYAEPCGKYLKKHFGERFSLIIGDSREVLPILFHDDKKFDGYHIDGGHETNIAETDLCNIINNADNGSIICFDDTDYQHLRPMLTLYLLKGSVTNVFDKVPHLASQNQMFLRVTK